MDNETRYHEGEVEAQRRVGVLTEAARNGRMISDEIIRGALRFVAEQPMAVVTCVGAFVPRSGRRAWPGPSQCIELTESGLCVEPEKALAIRYGGLVIRTLIELISWWRDVSSSS